MIPALVRRSGQIIGPDGRNGQDSVHDVPRVLITDTLASDGAARCGARCSRMSSTADTRG